MRNALLCVRSFIPWLLICSLVVVGATAAVTAAAVGRVADVDVVFRRVMVRLTFL